MKKLRDYQLDIINRTVHSNKSTLIQVPTGGGKTVIAKEIIKDIVGKFNKQVLFVVPKIILMKQTKKEFKGLEPLIIHGIKQYDKNHKVLVSTLQTASRRDINPDVIIIDEIHYGFKGKMIERLIKDKPNTRIIGLSATPYDINGKQLKGFDLILDKYDMKYMVENKYLVDIESHVLTKIEKLDTVKTIGGDYNIQELSKIVCDKQTILEIVGSTAEYIRKYKKTIVFAVDINHAKHLTEAYQHEGFDARVLHSNLRKEEQERIIRRFEEVKEGQTKILVSVLMLTTGFNVPDTDVAIIARPTKSQNLYKQMVGRVLRTAPNKTHAVLLDCGNVIENLGMPLEPIKATQTQKISDNKQRCEKCESENLKLKHKDEKSFWECENCGYTKAIEHGTYECISCHQLYKYNPKIFSIKDNKLFLNCNDCPYPTLISKYTGSEIFVQVDDKKSHVKKMEEKNEKIENTIINKQNELENYMSKNKHLQEKLHILNRTLITKIESVKKNIYKLEKEVQSKQIAIDECTNKTEIYQKQIIDEKNKPKYDEKNLKRIKILNIESTEIMKKRNQLQGELKSDKKLNKEEKTRLEELCAIREYRMKINRLEEEIESLRKSKF